jgi:hypothetical protein
MPRCAAEAFCQEDHTLPICREPSASCRERGKGKGEETLQGSSFHPAAFLPTSLGAQASDLRQVVVAVTGVDGD